MNIYTKRRSWKVFLLAVASIIVIVSLWYTNGFIRKIAENEKAQVELWANAISRKADLVNYTETLFENLRQKEKRYVYLWSEATSKFINAESDDDIGFYTGVISGNKDIPVIVTDEKGNIIAQKNLDKEDSLLDSLPVSEADKFTSYPSIIVPYYQNQYNYIYYKNSKTYYQLKSTLDDLTSSFLDEIVNNRLSTPVIVTDSSRTQVMAFGGQVDSLVLTDSDFLASAIAEMEKSKMPIEVHLPNKGQNYIFYSESPTLTRMRYFPIVLLSVIGLFLILSYVLFSISRRSEESKIWAGMAKETAHQLGTPISSLMGWVEVMKLNYPEEQGFDEMNKDVDRLTLVSERFSKIGSNPELSDNDLNDILQSVVEYMQRRTSNKISIQLHTTSQEHIIAKVNKHLIIWVFENLIRNAVDAIGTEAGRIDLRLEATEKGIGIEVSDTGKGIAASQQKRVFDPGYSTKLRGWGLGLSLSRRIVEEYHKGRIYVKSSTLGQGTVFRVVLKTNLGKNKG